MSEEQKAQSGYLSKLIIILLLIVVGWLGWNYYQVKSGGVVALPGNNQTASVDDSAEITTLIKQFGKVIMLPEGEPRLLTVSNAEALATEQPFFAGSQDGDKVLVYTEVGRAYILSPSRNLVINVGPVVNEPAKTEDASADSAAPAPKAESANSDTSADGR
mgnify:CR=1 FL=1